MPPPMEAIDMEEDNDDNDDDDDDGNNDDGFDGENDDGDHDDANGDGDGGKEEGDAEVGCGEGLRQHACPRVKDRGTDLSGFRPSEVELNRTTEGKDHSRERNSRSC